MNSNDVLLYGHGTVLEAVEGLPEEDWLIPGACGVWSVKDIIAHLASFEVVLVDVLRSLTGGEPSPLLRQFVEAFEEFNDRQVELRRHKPVEAVMREYNDAYAQASALLAEIEPELRRRNGVIPWYGDTYDLDDFIVYTFYGHKREHGAQINAFRDRLSK